MIVFGASDGVSHYFWQYCDPNCAFFTDQPPGLRDSILRVYQELDRQLGELLALLPAETTVFVLSDHGMTPSSSYRNSNRNRIGDGNNP